MGPGRSKHTTANSRVSSAHTGANAEPGVTEMSRLMVSPLCSASCRMHLRMHHQLDCRRYSWCNRGNCCRTPTGVICSRPTSAQPHAWSYLGYSASPTDAETSAFLILDVGSPWALVSPPPLSRQGTNCWLFLLSSAVLVTLLLIDIPRLCLVRAGSETVRLR